MDNSGDYDDDFHEMSVSGSGNLSKGEESAKPGSAAVGKQSELQGGSGLEDGGGESLVPILELAITMSQRRGMKRRMAGMTAIRSRRR